MDLARVEVKQPNSIVLRALRDRDQAVGAFENPLVMTAFPRARLPACETAASAGKSYRRLCRSASRPSEWHESDSMRGKTSVLGTAILIAGLNILLMNCRTAMRAIRLQRCQRRTVMIQTRRYLRAAGKP